MTRVPSCKLHERETLHAMLHQRGRRPFGIVQIQRGPPGGIQHDKHYCFEVTGNTQASSESHFRSSRMCVSVSCSLLYVEQGRSTCNASRFLSVELFASQRV